MKNLLSGAGSHRVLSVFFLVAFGALLDSPAAAIEVESEASTVLGTCAGSADHGSQIAMACDYENDGEPDWTEIKSEH